MPVGHCLLTPPPGLTVVLALPPCRPARGPRFGRDSHPALGGPDPARSPLCSAVFLGLWVMSGNREKSRLPSGGPRVGRAAHRLPRASALALVPLPPTCAPRGPLSLLVLSSRPTPRTLPTASTARPQWLHCSTCSGSSAGFPGTSLTLVCLRLSERCRPLPRPLPAAALQGPAKGLCTSRSECQDKCRVPGPMVRLLQPFPAPGQASDCRSLRCSPWALGCPARPGRRALPSTCLKLQVPRGSCI